MVLTRSHELSLEFKLNISGCLFSHSKMFQVRTCYYKVYKAENKIGFVRLAAIAQLGERQTEDLKVPGSIPGRGTA